MLIRRSTFVAATRLNRGASSRSGAASRGVGRGWGVALEEEDARWRGAEAGVGVGVGALRAQRGGGGGQQRGVRLAAAVQRGAHDHCAVQRLL